MKAWRFYGFNDMRLDEVPEPQCGPGQVLIQPLCVQPSVTEAQLAKGIPTLAFDRIKRRLEAEAPIPLFGHEFCARVMQTGPRVDRFRPGDRVAARAALEEGLDTAVATGQHLWDAELHRLTGTVLLAENKLNQGEASLQQAIRIAQAQKAKSLELRAARDVARLWGEQGRRTEARDLLTPVYGWFTEGFDTPDLKEAKALLDELG